MLSRRDLIRLGCCSAATVGLRNFSRFGWMNAMAAQAAPSTGYRALVCVFLFGGNDANNMIIPMDSARFHAYTNLRKDLALPGSSLLPTPVGTELYGFHQKLSGVQKLFTAGNAAVVANVGTLVRPLTRIQYTKNQAPAPNNLFSHADQQLQWQTSVPNGVSTSGWAGRVADKIEYRNSPSTFPTIVSVSGNAIFGTGAQTAPGTVIPGTHQRSHVGKSAEWRPGFENCVPEHVARLAVAGGSQDHPGEAGSADEPSDLLLLAGRL